MADPDRVALDSVLRVVRSMGSSRDGGARRSRPGSPPPGGRAALRSEVLDDLPGRCRGRWLKRGAGTAPGIGRRSQVVDRQVGLRAICTWSSASRSGSVMIACHLGALTRVAASGQHRRVQVLDLADDCSGAEFSRDPLARRLAHRSPALPQWLSRNPTRASASAWGSRVADGVPHPVLRAATSGMPPTSVAAMGSAAGRPTRAMRAAGPRRDGSTGDVAGSEPGAGRPGGCRESPRSLRLPLWWPAMAFRCLTPVTPGHQQARVGIAALNGSHRFEQVGLALLLGERGEAIMTGASWGRSRARRASALVGAAAKRSRSTKFGTTRSLRSG